MSNNTHNITGMGGTAGFVLYVALLTILTAGTVGGFLLYSAFNHSQAARRWHASDQCLLDAQSAMEQVKYEMIQAYGSNGQSSAAWFLNWSSNAIGATPRYAIPSPLTVNGTPVYVTVAGVAVITNAGSYLVNLTLVADARKSDYWVVRRKIQEQMQVQISPGGTSAVVNSAFGKYGNKNTINISGQLTIDGHNWNVPASFPNGTGSTNKPSTNDMPGVVYDSTMINTGVRVTINGNPAQTSAGGATNATYWNQFLAAILPAATVVAGGGDSLGTRAAPLIKIFPVGATTIASARSGAGILIIPAGATLKINQSFYYEGIVIMGSSDASQSVSLTVNNTTTIYGTMVCIGSASAANIIVPGILNVLYSTQALANLSKMPNMPQQIGASGGTNASPVTIGWKEIH